MDINFEISFNRIPCGLLNIDARDLLGEQITDISHQILKLPLDEAGTVKGVSAPVSLGIYIYIYI